jgi:hypothetical protein
MKLRLANASHSGLAYFAYLAGHRFVHEACLDPLFASFLESYMDSEARPTLDPVPGVDLAAYQQAILERFANPAVRDTVARLCADGSSKIPRFLLPVIRANLDTGGPSAYQPQSSRAGRATPRASTSRATPLTLATATPNGCAKLPTPSETTLSRSFVASGIPSATPHTAERVGAVRAALIRPTKQILADLRTLVLEPVDKGAVVDLVNAESRLVVGISILPIDRRG